MEKCGSCFWWQKQQNNNGRCMVNPPTAMIMQVQGIGGPDLTAVTFWPETPDTGYCSKWGADGVLNPARSPIKIG